jgi:hypothetical protein
MRWYDDAGQLRLMELELVEPSLYLKYHPPTAKLFAHAVLKRLQALCKA